MNPDAQQAASEVGEANDAKPSDATAEPPAAETTSPKPAATTGTAANGTAVPRGRWIGAVFSTVCLLAAWFGVLVLALLLAGTLVEAWGWVDWQFLTSRPTGNPEKAGARVGIWGTFWLTGLTGLFAIPVGVGAAVYLEEFASDNWLRKLVQVNLANLAGVPSVVYGILGLTAFVRMFGLVGDNLTVRIPADGLAAIPVPFSDAVIRLAQLEIPLPFGRSVVAGALTMSLLILPVIIVASQEALRAVPPSIRHASLALGATKWQTIRRQVLPAAAPGIMTGVILAVSRAIGETAPLLMIGTASYIPRSPGGIESVADLATGPARLLDVPFDGFTTLTLLVFGWIKEPESDFQHVTAAGVVVLLVVLLLLNALAILIRNRFQKNVNW